VSSWCGARCTQIDGNWPHAASRLQVCHEILPEDGPTNALLCTIENLGNAGPSVRRSVGRSVCLCDAAVRAGAAPRSPWLASRRRAPHAGRAPSEWPGWHRLTSK
jgi:hypothetical protein